jgi:hypothetical protein
LHHLQLDLASGFALVASVVSIPTFFIPIIIPALACITIKITLPHSEVHLQASQIRMIWAWKLTLQQIFEIIVKKILRNDGV